MGIRNFFGVNENSSLSEQITTVRHRARLALGIGAAACVSGLMAPVIAGFTGNSLGMEIAKAVEVTLEGVAVGSVALAGAEVFTLADLEDRSSAT